MDDYNNTSYYCLEHFQRILCRRIVPVFHEEFDKIYRNAARNRVLMPESLFIENVQVAQYRNPILPQDFQDALCAIPVMNQTMIDKLYSKVCAGEEPFVNKLIKAIFAYSTQLACLSSNVVPTAIDMSVPDGPHFVHSALVTAARRLWCNPLLLCVEGMTPYQKFKQNGKFQDLLTQCVLDQLQSMMPTANLLNHLQYGTGDMEDPHTQQDTAVVDLRRQDLNYSMPAQPMPSFPSFPPPEQPLFQPEANQNTLMPMPSSSTASLDASTAVPLTTTTTVTETSISPDEAKEDHNKSAIVVEEVDSSSDEEEEEEDDDKEEEEGEEREEPQETKRETTVQRVEIAQQLPTRNLNETTSPNVIRIDTGI